jgi:16S rRNA (guanine527-N7)-methyltransferase
MPLPIDLFRRHQETFARYQSLLLKWNEKVNLTAITDPQEILEKHFLDSLAVLMGLAQWLPNVSRETFEPECLQLSILDIGAGAGFPGIPLKIVAPELDLTLVDSVRKKCDFLKEAVRWLGLNRTRVIHHTLKGEAVGSFDVIVTRATFDLKTYATLAAPNLKPEGILIAMKGPAVEGERKDSLQTLGRFKLRPWEGLAYELPFSKVSRQILMTRKV